MATIGTFTKTANGDITGTVKPLSVNLKAKFVPTEDESETGRDSLSVKLDDPSFPARIDASLVEDEGGEAHNLIWSRRTGD